MSDKSRSYLWLKWHIFIQVFPITLMFCLLKLLIHQQRWELGTFDSQTGALLASVLLRLEQNKSLEKVDRAITKLNQLFVPLLPPPKSAPPALLVFPYLT